MIDTTFEEVVKELRERVQALEVQAFESATDDRIERLEDLVKLLPELAHKLHRAEETGSIPQSQREMKLRRELLNRITDVENKLNFGLDVVNSIKDCVESIREDVHEIRFHAKDEDEFRNRKTAANERLVKFIDNVPKGGMVAPNLKEPRGIIGATGESEKPVAPEDRVLTYSDINKLHSEYLRCDKCGREAEDFLLHLKGRCP